MPHQLDPDMLVSDGDPGAGTEVTVDLKGVRTRGTLDAYSDEEGHAGFETAADDENPRELSIRGRGQSFGPYRIGGGAYTVPLD
ncbi:MAG: hypothetical protein IPN92_20290 [Chromatiaceae bacterium]|nr:hypothetical protein [Chromatiaceae bacterium]